MREPTAGLIGGDTTPNRWSRVGDRLAWYASAIGVERSARIASVLVVPVFAAGEFFELRTLFAAVLAYVLVTAWAPRNEFVRAGDLVVATAVIMALGAGVTPFLPFLLVVVAGPASRGGVVAGLAAGGTLAIALIAGLVWNDQLAELGLARVLPIAMLLPLAGLTIAAASQLLEDHTVRDRMVLQEANRLLSSLRAIAEDIPGGLDVSTVSAALIAELRSVQGVSAVVVYAEDHGVLQPTGSAEVPTADLPSLRLDELRSLASSPRLRSPHGLPDQLHRAADAARHWAVVGLGSGDALAGVLLVGFTDLEDARAARPRLASLGSDGQLALENARLFDGTRARAADAARRRVAGDLHDGVAQSLAHLRMELEMLAREVAGDDDVERLARVAGSALDDLRSTIAGLRQPLSGDLPQLLARHLDEVSSTNGPELVLEATPEMARELSRERTEDAWRVAQEAISNALRHAQADTVTVSLERDGELLVMEVLDDGVGRSADSAQRGGGVGLRSMRERADRLGGELHVRDRVGGGTVVSLRFPSSPAPAPAVR
jgi:signal transduction histidine kinase